MGMINMEIYGLLPKHFLLAMGVTMKIISTITLWPNLIIKGILLIQFAMKTVKKLCKDLLIFFGVTIYMSKIGAMIEIKILFGINMAK